jgi:hypothetical protein
MLGAYNTRDACLCFNILGLLQLQSDLQLGSHFSGAHGINLDSGRFWALAQFGAQLIAESAS